MHGLPSSVQVVPAASFVSAGQFGPAPEQDSATSHSPAAPRHGVPAGAKASAGQVALVPSQASARSHGLAAGRHTAPAFPAGCWQVVLAPSHRSRVQGLPSSAQGVPAALLVSAGHAALAPVQVSATSQSPALVMIARKREGATRAPNAAAPVARAEPTSDRIARLKRDLAENSR